MNNNKQEGFLFFEKVVLGAFLNQYQLIIPISDSLSIIALLDYVRSNIRQTFNNDILPSLNSDNPSEDDVKNHLYAKGIAIPLDTIELPIVRPDIVTKWVYGYLAPILVNFAVNKESVVKEINAKFEENGEYDYDR